MFSTAGSSQRVVPSSQPYSQVSSPASYGVREEKKTTASEHPIAEILFGGFSSFFSFKVPSPQSLQVPMFGGQLNIPSPQTSYGSVSPQHSYLPSSSSYSDHLLEVCTSRGKC